MQFFCFLAENWIVVHLLIWYFVHIVYQAWDLGYGFDMGVLYKTGWLVFFGSMGAAAALAYFLWKKYLDFLYHQEWQIYLKKRLEDFSAFMHMALIVF